MFVSLLIFLTNRNEKTIDLNESKNEANAGVQNIF
jgi:hypothetical protein